MNKYSNLRFFAHLNSYETLERNIDYDLIVKNVFSRMASTHFITIILREKHIQSMKYVLIVSG
jgi:hypothetical protein